MSEEDPLAEQLARLTLPAPSALSVGYAAGLAAGRRRARAWRWTAAAAAMVAVAVAARRPPAMPVFIDRLVYTQRADPIDASTPAPVEDVSTMLAFQKAVLTDPTLASLPLAGGRGMPPRDDLTARRLLLAN